MKRSRRSNYLVSAISITLLLIVTVTATLASQAAPPPSPEQIIRNAWKLAQESGRYHFATEIEQTTYPAPKLANVGRSSRKDQVYLEGQTNLPDRSLTMSLWAGQDNPLNPQDTVEIRIEDDRAYGRQRQDAPWQEVDDFSGAFAPDGDLLAYLAGARNISEIGTRNSELGIRYSQYAFDLDGLAFARYVRDQLSDQLRRSGELPPGITLNTSREYQEVTGNGKVWIDSDGLPLRLTVRLEYPPQENGERVVADITTDFSNFDRAALAQISPSPSLPISLSQLGLPRTPDDWRQLGQQAGLMAGFVILMLLLVTHGRSKQVYAAFVLAIILAMIVTPLLQSQQVYAFSQRQEAEQAAYEERQAEVDATREMREDLTTSDWNPRVDPLAETQTYQETFPSLPLSPSLSPSSASTAAPDPTSDADHDGLTYIQEQRLGTDPNDVDTDGDQITDYAEVRGFQLGSQRWYGNPLDADTNKDTLADTQECWATMPPTLPANTACNLDTDRDGTPDLFDRDNDNDGVDDRVDASPFSKIGSGAHFTRANPFQLQVNGFTAGEPLFVDFQLRPANAAHLSYALNVLDWPSGDTAGQVQRVKDTTFADGLTAAQRAADPSNANGDMRLIPMLEIEIPYQSGHYGNLPVKPGASSRGPTTPVDNWLDRSKMAVHSISVRRINEQGALGVYVPINMVYDELGAGRSAFSARMPYFPTMANWDGNHQVRLVWVVQMKTDYCRASGAPDDPDQFKSWCAQPQNREERIQIVHTYYDDWSLTGLAVREDRGMDVAIAFEDPATDSNLNRDDNLWKLGNGLGKAFITGRNSNGVTRDITISEIRARFDSQSNGSIPNGDNRLWNIPKTALRVQTYSFEHEDFIAHIPMTYTKQILQNHFTSYGSPRADAPTLLIAREERARTATLDMSTEVMSVNGRVLAVNLSDTHTPVSVMASVAWKPYRYRSGAWQPYPIQEYWDRLDVQLRGTIFAGTTDLTLQDGQVIAAQCYYHSLFHGLNNVVQSGSAVLYNTSGDDPAAEDDDDDDITGWIEFGGDVFTTAVEDVGEELADNAPDEPQGNTPSTRQARGRAALKDLGGASQRGALEAQSRVGRMAKYKARAKSTGGILLTVGFFVAGAASGDDDNTAEQIEKGLQVVEAVQELVTTVKDIRAATRGVSGFANKMNAVSKTFTRAAAKIAVIGVIIAAGVAFGVFIAQMVDQGVSFGSLEFNAALAKTIATVVATAILAAIAFIPIVGQIIAAVIAVIDAVIALICAIGGEDFEEGDVGQYLCKGVEGWMGEAIAWGIYGGHAMVDMENPDRLKVGGPAPSLVRPQDGFSQGNQLSYSIALTNTIDLLSWSWQNTHLDWKSLVYRWQFNNSNLKSSTFSYALSAQEQDIHGGLSRGSMSGDWRARDNDDDAPYYIAPTVSIDSAIPITRAGINVPISLYLAEGAVLPLQECFVVPGPGCFFAPGVPFVCLIPICHIRDTSNTAHINLGSSIKWDIFPATLSEFHALSWGAFPAQRDHDGDGLLSPGSGGSDPNDRNWDTDGDLLSDFYEEQTGSNLQSQDSDGDGQNDRAEALLGSNPNRIDSDGDGLTDQQEVTGWEFVYDFSADGTQLRTWVTSDPLTVDGDGDTLTDAQEKIFGFHPRVWSDPTVLTYEAQVYEQAAGGTRAPTDGFVKPNDTLYYEGTARNELFNRYANGLLQTDFPTSVAHTIHPSTFILQPQQETTLSGNVQIRSDAPSGSVDLTQTAGAIIVDRREASDYADLWLKFDESAGAMTFADSSGAMPQHNANCLYPHSCPTAGQAGANGSALHFDGGDVLAFPQPNIFNYGADQDFTVAFWVKTAGWSGARCIVCNLDGDLSRGSGIALTGHPNGSTWNIRVRDNRSNSMDLPGGTINDDRWHHIAVTFTRRGDMITYQDGVQASRSSMAHIGDLRARFIYCIGGLTTDSSYFFPGSIDDVRIFPRALRADEIRDLIFRPVLHLQFEEPSGDFYDNYGNRASVIEGSPVRVPGFRGQGVQFREGDPVWIHGHQYPSGDRLRVHDNPNLDLSGGRFSISAWVNYTGTGGYVLGAQGYPCIWIGPDQPGQARGSVKVGVNCSTAASSWNLRGPADYRLSSNTWHHIVGTYDGNTYRLYIDGTSVWSTGAFGSQRPSWYRSFALGAADLWTYGGYFDGIIDEVSVYRQVLSPEQVDGLYRASITSLHLPFDEPPGAGATGGFANMVDLRGLSNGTCTSTACPASGVYGRINQGILFDGVDDHVTLGDVDLSGDYALAMWFKTPNPGDGRLKPLISKQTTSTNPRDGTAELCFQINGNGAPTFFMSSNEAKPDVNLQGGVLAADRWYHAVMVMQNNHATFYLDGTPVATDRFDGTRRDGSRPLLLGAYHNPGPHYFPGAIDDLRAYSKALSPAEVQALYQSAPTLVLHLDEPAGATVFSDASGNGLKKVSDNLTLCRLNN